MGFVSLVGLLDIDWCGEARDFQAWSLRVVFWLRLIGQPVLCWAALLAPLLVFQCLYFVLLCLFFVQQRMVAMSLPGA